MKPTDLKIMKRLANVDYSKIQTVYLSNAESIGIIFEDDTRMIFAEGKNSTDIFDFIVNVAKQVNTQKLIVNNKFNDTASKTKVIFFLNTPEDYLKTVPNAYENIDFEYLSVGANTVHLSETYSLVFVQEKHALEFYLYLSSWRNKQEELNERYGVKDECID